MLPCTTCAKKGKMKCILCDGEGDGAFPCLTCRGARSVPCVGCDRGSYRYWDVCAASFEAAGDFERTLAYLDVVLVRLETYFGARISDAEGDGDQQLALKRERDRARKTYKLRRKEVAKR